MRRKRRLSEGCQPQVLFSNFEPQIAHREGKNEGTMRRIEWKKQRMEAIKEERRGWLIVARDRRKGWSQTVKGGRQVKGVEKTETKQRGWVNQVYSKQDWQVISGSAEKRSCSWNKKILYYVHRSVKRGRSNFWSRLFCTCHLGCHLRRHNSGKIKVRQGKQCKGTRHKSKCKYTN